MNVLFFSIFLNIILLIIIYFSSKEKKISSKLLIYFGLFAGFSSLSLTYLFGSCFGASTPIDIKTQNITNQNLSIYAIAFWDDYGNGSGNFVNYNSELEPNETSEFCIDSDGGKFWIVAKNKENEIVYLEETENKKTDFKINVNQNAELDKNQLAKELTFKKDKSVELEMYLVLTNIILIVLLGIRLLKK
ncbi:hypothetical protein [Flavobacterium algicola]|uniref:hypothetical protein n=1 Tax=Flavobacterium algicola TaxID=556529 RepID=UPI001EFC94DA|nr:hypothetical protein [Flavobacterium algicola]MCG9792631.1 hypothetical protein [Flavobacterium algicola]